MNLARHAALVWRFRGVAAAGLALGIILAVLATYQVGWKGGPSLTPRGSEVWTAVSSIHVTQPGFPEGRVTLPESQIDTAVTAEGRPAVPKNSPPDAQVEFADPNRLGNLADLYSKLLMSADVLNRVPGRPEASQIEASPFAASAGGQILPVIQLTTNSGSQEGAARLNIDIYQALSNVLSERQEANDIPVGKRVELTLLNPPAVTLTSGRSLTMAILALLLSSLGTLAVIHILYALRGTRADTNDDDFAPAVSWASVPPRYEDHTPPEDLRGERVGAGAQRQTPAGER